MITVAYITAPSEKGQKLCEMAVPALEKVISEQLCEEIAWAIINHPDYPEYCGVNLPQRQLMAYNCFHGADLVIFDGSIDSKDSEDSETPKTLRYKKSSSRGKSISIDSNVCFKIENMSDVFEKSFLPEMTEAQYTEIARKFSNSNPQLTCYELDEDVSLAELPDNVKEILADWNLEFIKENYSFIENSSNYPKEKIIESYNSYAQSKAFREKLIVECNECCQQSDYTVDDFINLRYSYRLDKTVLGEKTGEKINKKGVITLPCGHSIKVKEGETYYRFLQPRCCDHALNKEGWIVKPIRPVEVADVAEVWEVAE